MPNFIKMLIFYEKILTHKINSRFFYPKMEIFIKKGRVEESRLLYPKNRQFF